jgi:hypothetical protein
VAENGGEAEQRRNGEARRRRGLREGEVEVGMGVEGEEGGGKRRRCRSTPPCQLQCYI